jgi:hypothetical protein
VDYTHLFPHSSETIHIITPKPIWHYIKSAVNTMMCNNQLFQFTWCNNFFVWDLRFSRQWRCRWSSGSWHCVDLYVPPTYWYPPTSPHGAATQKTNMDNRLLSLNCLPKFPSIVSLGRQTQGNKYPHVPPPSPLLTPWCSTPDSYPGHALLEGSRSFPQFFRTWNSQFYFTRQSCSGKTIEVFLPASHSCSLSCPVATCYIA